MDWTFEGVLRHSPAAAKRNWNSPQARDATQVLAEAQAAEMVEQYAEGLRAGRAWAASADPEALVHLRAARGLTTEADWGTAFGKGDLWRNEGAPGRLFDILCVEHAGDADAADAFWRRLVPEPRLASSRAFLSGFAAGALAAQAAAPEGPSRANGPAEDALAAGGATEDVRPPQSDTGAEEQPDGPAARRERMRVYRGLTSPDGDLRRAAVAVLAEDPCPGLQRSYIDLLVWSLGDRDAGVRQAAAASLRELGLLASTALVLGALRAEAEAVRLGAREVLGEVGRLLREKGWADLARRLEARLAGRPDSTGPARSGGRWPVGRPRTASWGSRGDGRGRRRGPGQD
jgi:hypothetical protein